MSGGKNAGKARADAYEMRDPGVFVRGHDRAGRGRGRKER